MTRVKTVMQSIVERRLPFSTDETLRQQYINTFGDVRFGLILEELDHLAGQSAMKHIQRPDLFVVTAAVDRIDLIHPVRINQDLYFIAQVNYVGRTSCEVGIKIRCKTEHGFKDAAHCYFTMVAVNRDFVPTPIDPIFSETAEQERVMEEARQRKEEHKHSRLVALDHLPPTAEESKMIHDIYLAARRGYQGILMDKTRLEVNLYMHPQDKNVFGKVFGGFVMRTGYELAWTCAYKFATERPLIASVDRINFEKPVEVGALVNFTAMVLYVGTSSMTVEVIVKTINPKKQEAIVTNSCYFTLIAMDKNRLPIPAPRVVPRGYEESLKYIEGFRHYQKNQVRRHLLSA